METDRGVAVLSAAADRLVARYGWQLLTTEEILTRLAEREVADCEPQVQITAVYTEALYNACSGREDQLRRERGYTELYTYLLRCAMRRFPDVAADATQRALEMVFVAFERCRVPSAFLAFASQQLLSAARVERRLLGRGETSLEDPQITTPTVESSAETGMRRLVAADVRAQLRTCVASFIAVHPRARDQFAALWLKYVDQLDDQAIAQQLRRTVASVHTLRSRAIARLRADPQWQLLAIELGA